MKIRVLHVIDHLGYGGAPFVVKNLVERMPSDLVESVVCALRPNLKPLPIDATVVTLESKKYSLTPIRLIAGLCRDREIDIVHAHLQKAFLSSLWARPRFAGRLVLHEHGPIFRGGTGCVYRGFLRGFGSRADAIIANSRAAATAIAQVIGPLKIPIAVVPNFLDLERFDPDRYDRERARASLGLTKARFVVGFVGRLDRPKGADLLVEAAAKLPCQEKAWSFYLVGDGPQRRDLQERVRRLGLEGIVTLGGLHENPAVALRAFDVVVVPSRREAFGLAALEAMRMRVPVVVSPVGGLPELIQDGDTGIVLPRLDAGSIAGAIQRLASDEALRNRLANNAFDHAGKFDGQSAVEQVVELYRRLMRGT
ncbi:MAG TPA: glycosyltransferase [Sedimentisphaerales bacterium]|nr:glycosyltransferase [Sedimentisphaerales bacterium]HQG49110.1 glycosyltransferase [Sedimentisphaerales bacterium]